MKKLDLAFLVVLISLFGACKSEISDDVKVIINQNDRIFSAKNCNIKESNPLLGTVFYNRNLLDTSKSESIRVFVINNERKSLPIYLVINFNKPLHGPTYELTLFRYDIIIKKSQGMDSSMENYDIRNDPFFHKGDGLMNCNLNSSGYSVIVDQCKKGSVFVKSVSLTSFNKQTLNKSALLLQVFNILDELKEYDCQLFSDY